MAYNADLIKAQRAKTDEKARKMFRGSGGGQLPFVKENELRDGTYSIRFWPTSEEKNPFGFLDWRTHVYELRTEKERLDVLCPRTSNWDPLPIRWEDPETGSEVEAGEGMPIFQVRCYACELMDQIRDLDIMDRFSDSLKRVVQGQWAQGAGKIPGMWGKQSFFAPATIKMEIAMKEERQNRAGTGTYTVTEFQPSMTNLYHCLVSFDAEKQFVDLLKDQIMACPDLFSAVAGRWLHLTKQNGGKGTGGYSWRMDPNPSSMGFEYPKNLYPNFSTWGAGGGQKPSKRKDYRELEIMAGDPRLNQPPVFWWAQPMRDLGLVLTDNEADHVPF